VQPQQQRVQLGSLPVLVATSLIRASWLSGSARRVEAIKIV
jgi:hypothetical protein